MADIDIKQLIMSGEIKQGAQIIKVPIDKVNGKKYNGQTYMIPLKYLYYNNQNGRIGTEISKYESEHGPLDSHTSENYNEIIQKAIIDGDEKKMEELERDIAVKGQEIPGYVLNDGRVIDGNRRFTACRMLAQDKKIDTLPVFEAVLIDDLDADKQDEKGLLKQLELKIQFGQLGREDYDPIDKAIDAYRTVVLDHLMTAKKYAEYANLKKNDVDKQITEAELIIEFLKYINADTSNYSIAKKLSLDGPLQDLVPQYKKYIKDDPNKDTILNAIFAKLIQLREKSDDNDFKQEFRTIVKKVIGKKMAEDFVEDMGESSDTILDVLSEEKTVDSNDLFAKLNDSEEAKDAIKETQSISENYAQKAVDESDKLKPENLISQAKSKIDNVDQSVFGTLNDGQKEKLRNLLDEIVTNITDMKQELE